MADALSLLRHAVATIAYRGGKCLRNVPDTFADFAGPAGVRTPVQLLAHIGDLFDWTLHLADGRQDWHPSSPLQWDLEVARFFDALARFDARLASDAPLGSSAEQLLQGPVADALTHIGQLAMLRRMAGGPVRGENYFRAGVQVGRVGPDQAPPVFEFD